MAVIDGRRIMARIATVSSSNPSLISRSHAASPHRLLMARDATTSPMTSPLTNNLLFVLLGLVLAATLAAGVLLLIRRHKQRRAQRDSLPTYSELPHQSRSQHRRHGGRPAANHVEQEKRRLMSESDEPRESSPVPEIRITLPEEVDESGKAQSGRVVVVHMGQETVGFEPYDNRLPSYQQSESDRFDSVDIDRIGGLKEKEQF